MKLSIPVLLFTLFVFGCKKSSTEDEYYTIQGLVLDIDSKTPIPAAKVYLNEFVGRSANIDSAIADANGRVSFTLKKEGTYKLLSAVKVNYLNPLIYGFFVLAHVSRTDTVYLGRSSFVDLTLHKTNTYLPTDSILVSVSGDYESPTSGHTFNYRFIIRDNANMPDRLLNLYTLYVPTTYEKLFFTTHHIRNGVEISVQNYSTDLIRYGTKSYTINY